MVAVWGLSSTHTYLKHRAEGGGGTEGEVCLDSQWSSLPGQVHFTGGAGPGICNDGVMVGVGAGAAPTVTSSRGQSGAKHNTVF